MKPEQAEKPIQTQNLYSRPQKQEAIPDNLRFLWRDGIIESESEKERQANEEYLKHSHAESTLEIYGYDWREFLAFCSKSDPPVASLPAEPETILSFLRCQAEQNHKPSTITRKLSAIRCYHLEAEVETIPTDNPKVKRMMAAIRRLKGVMPEQKKPLTIQRLNAIIEKCPPTLCGCRDKAMLRLGFAGGFRRSELLALRMEDIDLSEVGVEILIRRSKTDQEGYGRLLSIPRKDVPLTCPVAALEEWIERGMIREGPIFRRLYKGDKVGETAITGRSFAKIIDKYVEQVGLDQEDFSPHALRAGFVTSAYRSGASIAQIQGVTGHRSAQSVHRYVRGIDGFREYPNIEE